MNKNVTVSALDGEVAESPLLTPRFARRTRVQANRLYTFSKFLRWSVFFSRSHSGLLLVLAEHEMLHWVLGQDLRWHSAIILGAHTVHTCY